MRESPPPTQLLRYPVVAVTAAAAIAASIAYWSERDVSFLFMDPHLSDGQLWRLATSVFPHVDVLHLVFNLYWLWVFGTAVETGFGHARTAGLVLLFAVGSGAAEYAILDGGIGLSGVVYGLFGLLWILTLYDERFRDAVDARVVNLLVFWFFLCIFTTVKKIMPVANIAHGAGAVLGVLVAAAIVARPSRQTAFVAVMVALCVASVAGATFLRPRVNLSAYGGYGEAELGHAALVEGRNQEAEKWLLRATRLDPEESSYWYNLGIAQHRLEKLEEALASYRRACEIMPGDEDIASALEELKQWLEQQQQQQQQMASPNTSQRGMAKELMPP
jgi:GlpG protein